MPDIRLVWSVVCARSVIDKESNNVSLIDALEQIQVELVRSTAKAPVHLPFRIEWVTLWTRLLGEVPTVGRARDTIESPDGTVLFENEYDVDVHKKRRTRVTRRLGGLPLPASGTYRFLTHTQVEGHDTWQVVSDVPLEISIKKPAKAADTRRANKAARGK
ncbi:MAG: hypothetical protein V3R87_05840 [Dehalococcoidia bacterium]